MKTYTIHKPYVESGSSACQQRLIAVSLPAPPFDIPATDRTETAPRSKPIRSNEDWRKADRLLRYAEGIGQ